MTETVVVVRLNDGAGYACLNVWAWSAEDAATVAEVHLYAMAGYRRIPAR